VGCTAVATCGVEKYIQSPSTSTADTICGVCTKGTASLGDQVACTLCNGEGEYSDADGATACKLAPAGNKPTENRENIEACPKNTFSTRVSDTCTKCPEGGHSDIGASACDFCGQHKLLNDTLGECNCIDTFVLDDNNKCTCPTGMTLDGDRCVLCEKAKFKGDLGVKSCALCEDMLKGAITKEVGSTTNSSCICPAGTFDNLKKEDRRCEIVDEGVSEIVEGMTLESLSLELGFWRTDKNSLDIRQCPVEPACVGGNSTDEDGYCLEGHEGPYCNICKAGYTKDAFRLCKSCEMNTANVAITLGGIVCFLTITYIFRLLIKKYSRVNKLLVKRLKNCGKIIFSAWQIASSLPSTVPTIPLPTNYKEAVGVAQVLNGNIFQLVAIGCLTRGAFTYYHQVLCLTLIIILACVVLYLMGRGRDEMRRERYFNAALALTYLTLPTITTLLFGMIPCDTLDNEKRYLRADYSINCDAPNSFLWSIYTAVMILLFPIGIISGYSYLLWKNRARINQPVEDREKDHKLMAIGFLFDPYKPEYWYFEIVETVRRLAMTGVLSIIAPGSFTQLSVGLFFSIAHTLTVGVVRPYTETRDNILSFLSSCQLILVFMSSSFLKYQNTAEDPYDSAGMGAILLFSYAATFVSFVAWAFYAKDDLSTSNTGMASNVLRGKLSREMSNRVKETELVGVGGDRRGSRFKAENPMFQPKSKSLFDSDKGHKDEGEEDAKPKARSPLGAGEVGNQSPSFRPPPQSTQVSSMDNVSEGVNLGDQDTSEGGVKGDIQTSLSQPPPAPK